LNQQNNSEKQFVQEQYEILLEEAKQHNDVLVTHIGELSQSVISSLESCIEEQIKYLDIPKGSVKKIFFICVETLQNMLIHGHKNSSSEQHNFFILKKNQDSVTVISANLTANDSIHVLEKQINVINSFDDDKALKVYYLEHLENNTMSDKGGAGLGFITIGMKSGNKLKTNFKKINNEFSLFILKATISIIKETV
jgi:hypothetical protein